MIHQTNVVLFGCQVWLEAPNVREFRRKEKLLIKWAEQQLKLLDIKIEPCNDEESRE